MQILRRNLLKAGLIIASATAFPRIILAWPCREYMALQSTLQVKM